MDFREPFTQFIVSVALSALGTIIGSLISYWGVRISKRAVTEAEGAKSSAEHAVKILNFQRAARDLSEIRHRCALNENMTFYEIDNLYKGISGDIFLIITPLEKNSEDDIKKLVDGIKTTLEKLKSTIEIFRPLAINDSIKSGQIFLHVSHLFNDLVEFTTKLSGNLQDKIV